VPDLFASCDRRSALFDILSWNTKLACNKHPLRVVNFSADIAADAQWDPWLYDC
jgi:hypothetical protein